MQQHRPRRNRKKIWALLLAALVPAGGGCHYSWVNTIREHYSFVSTRYYDCPRCGQVVLKSHHHQCPCDGTPGCYAYNSTCWRPWPQECEKCLPPAQPLVSLPVSPMPSPAPAPANRDSAANLEEAPQPQDTAPEKLSPPMSELPEVEPNTPPVNPLPGASGKRTQLEEKTPGEAPAIPLRESGREIPARTAPEISPPVPTPSPAGGSHFQRPRFEQSVPARAPAEVASLPTLHGPAASGPNLPGLPQAQAIAPPQIEFQADAPPLPEIPLPAAPELQTPSFVATPQSTLSESPIAPAPAIIEPETKSIPQPVLAPVAQVPVATHEAAAPPLVFRSEGASMRADNLPVAKPAPAPLPVRSVPAPVAKQPAQPHVPAKAPEIARTIPTPASDIPAEKTLLKPPAPKPQKSVLKEKPRQTTARPSVPLPAPTFAGAKLQMRVVDEPRIVARPVSRSEKVLAPGEVISIEEPKLAPIVRAEEATTTNRPQAEAVIKPAGLQAARIDAVEPTW